jgi:MarR family transcriptional regulator for hemolysin
MSEFLALFTRASMLLLLTMQRDAADARLVRLCLTNRARAIRGAIEAERRDLEHRAAATLTEEERRHLHSALRKIIMALAAVVPMDEPGDELP